MRHVSRTHRVALDRLFDRINLDTKIQIKYIDIKNQLADILTKGNFTRDEWKHLLCVQYQPFQFYSLFYPHLINGIWSTSFLDHVYLGCTQRQCKISQDIVDIYRTMFESRIPAVRLEKLPFSQNNRISSWSYDMEAHAKKCVERYCELANKTTQQLFKVSTPCIDDHHFKEEELKSVGELSKSMLSNCTEMLIFGTYWKTWYFMVSKQARTFHHKMDQSLWQTPESIDFYTFITQVDINSMLCG